MINFVELSKSMDFSIDDVVQIVFDFLQQLDANCQRLKHALRRRLAQLLMHCWIRVQLQFHAGKYLLITVIEIMCSLF